MNILHLCRLGRGLPSLLLCYLLYDFLGYFPHYVVAYLLALLALFYHLLSCQFYVLHLHFLLAEVHRACVILVPVSFDIHVLGYHWSFLKYYIFGRSAQGILHQPFLGRKGILRHGGFVLHLLLPLLLKNLRPEVHLPLLLCLI